MPNERERGPLTLPSFGERSCARFHSRTAASYSSLPCNASPRTICASTLLSSEAVTMRAVSSACS